MQGVSNAASLRGGRLAALPSDEPPASQLVDRPVLHNRTVHALRVDDGRIVEIWFHNVARTSVDAFWS